MTKPLFLKYGKFAGKSTITVSTEPGGGSGVGGTEQGCTKPRHKGGTGMGCTGDMGLGSWDGTRQDMWMVGSWGTGTASNWDIWVALA